MPRVCLTPAQRASAKAKDGNAALVRALNHHKIDTAQRWEDVAREIGTSPCTLLRWRDRPGVITLDDLRRLAAVVKMSPEDWLAVGGY